MRKAALVALPNFTLCDVSAVLQQLHQKAWRLRVYSFDGQPVTTMEGLRIEADAALLDAVPLDLDLLIVPGGAYDASVFSDVGLYRLLRQYDSHRKFFAASSEGVICLARAGLLGGTMYSAPLNAVAPHDTWLRHAIRQETPVTVDSNIISSDGTDTALFAKTVLDLADLGLDR